MLSKHVMLLAELLGILEKYSFNKDKFNVSFSLYSIFVHRLHECTRLPTCSNGITNSTGASDRPTYSKMLAKRRLLTL